MLAVAGQLRRYLEKTTDGVRADLGFCFLFEADPD
jgi:hypothetical protein